MDIARKQAGAGLSCGQQLHPFTNVIKKLARHPAICMKKQIVLPITRLHAVLRFALAWLIAADGCCFQGFSMKCGLHAFVSRKC